MPLSEKDENAVIGVDLTSKKVSIQTNISAEVIILAMSDSG